MKKCDILIIGASIGGTLAAYSAAKSGKKVILTEETDWIGGQLTSQAVPPDEHNLIESQGCTKTYREYRDAVRKHYQNLRNIVDEIKAKDFFCPGGSSVSRIAHEPKVALMLLNKMLQPFVDIGKIEILLNTTAISAAVSNDEIMNVTLSDKQIISAKIYLDGTECGDFLKLCGAEYRTGAESFDETGEFHAPKIGNKFDMQPVTWVAAVDNRGNQDCVGEKPAEYDWFRKLRTPYDKYHVLSMYGPDSSTGKAKQFGMFTNEVGKNGEKLFSLWTYRRIIAAHHYKHGNPYDVTLINWPQNDYFMDNIFDSADDEYNKYMAKQLTLSLIYWLQTECERPDGKKGYRGISLRGDVLGTLDGLAKYPYIRESRRIVPLLTVTENMISKKNQKKAPVFVDTVGVGSYHIDLHITTKSHTFFYDSVYPFQIPLGSMIPKRLTNLLPCCKNIGTTHLTNGCYRLHPIEWNIGEVAGYLAAFCINEKLLPREIYFDKGILERFQSLLTESGIQLAWENL
ncbi:MAG: FAD-dependent oxidoreductase [Firmicutes bacterium]|nr:FAD-dependent oxidoreductase [Bacillota bacterium]